jgi:hypothetical protein
VKRDVLFFDFLTDLDFGDEVGIVLRHLRGEGVGSP